MSAEDEFTIPHAILRHFDLSSSPYTEDVIAQTNERRDRYPENSLFIDKLLGYANIDSSSLYPPSTPGSLRRLLSTIGDASLDRLKKDCFFYYLLKDYDASSERSGQDREMDLDGDANEKSSPAKKGSRSEGFAQKRCLPKVWRIFMDGYWELDHGFWEAGIAHLSDPSINEVDFIPAILTTISTLVSPPSLACSLVHSFLTTVRPVLSSALETQIKLLALASTSSLSQVFHFIRAQPSNSQVSYRESVWCWALGSPLYPCGVDESGTHKVQSRALKALLHLPLRPEEHLHLIHFLSHPPREISSSSISLLHDLVTLRLVHQGRYQEILQLDKELAGSGGKDEERQKRREMVREFVAILPSAQRRVLLVEQTELNRNQNRIENGNELEAEPDDVEMDADWINVDSQPPSQPLARRPFIPQAPVSAVRPSSPFSGPPRFAPMLSSSSSQPIPSPTKAYSGSPFALPAASQSKTLQSLKKMMPSRKIVIDDDDFPSLSGSVRGRGKGPTKSYENEDVSMTDGKQTDAHGTPPPPP
ncbi:hypothetical protein P7C73_g6345, partial [Tremellales sp. Uapishka_1]